MANRMERLVQLAKKGLTAAPFSKTNPDLKISGETASTKTVDILEPIASTSKDLVEVSISPLNSNTSDNINVQEIDAICEGTKEDDQSVVPPKRKRSISSSSSDSSSSSSSSNRSSTSSSSNSSSRSSTSSQSRKGDSLPDDTHIVQLRRANNCDYEALGMPVPEKLIHIPDTNMTDKQTTDENIVQFEEMIDEGNSERAIPSPSILQTNNNANVLNEQLDMQISSYSQEGSDATGRNTKDHDSAEFGKENQKPSSPFVCLNEGSDFSADSGSEYHPPTSHPRRNRSSSTSSSIVSLTSATSNNKRGKKRVRNQNKWKENVRKTLKNSGQDYVSKKGNKIEAKKMRPPCHNCKFLIALRTRQ